MIFSLSLKTNKFFIYRYIIFQERDSVMLGEISPYHDYYDSKSSSETPPSYNQLNYNENLQRFFQSKPKTTVSEESSNAVQVENSIEVKVVSTNQ